jgi:hypothetical protein
MPKYRVHVYATVRIPIEVEAESPSEAAQSVGKTEIPLLKDTIRSSLIRGTGEYADDYEPDALVDLLDDEGNFTESWNCLLNPTPNEESENDNTTTS